MSDDLPMTPQEWDFWLEEYYEEIPGEDGFLSCRACGAAVARWLIGHRPTAVEDHVAWHRDAESEAQRSSVDRAVGRDQVLAILNHDRVGRLPAAKVDVERLLWDTYPAAKVPPLAGLLRQLVADGDAVECSGKEAEALGFRTGARGKALRPNSAYYLSSQVYAEATGQTAPKAEESEPEAKWEPLRTEHVIELLRHPEIHGEPLVLDHIDIRMHVLFPQLRPQRGLKGMVKRMAADGTLKALSGSDLMAAGVYTSNGRPVIARATYYTTPELVPGAPDSTSGGVPQPHPLAALFERRWVCGVGASGRHNGCNCTPNDPHDGWGCGWYWVANRLTDTEAAKYGLKEPEEKEEQS